MSRFVIRRVRSGPFDLRVRLPVTGSLFDSRTDPQGNDEFYCASLDEPLKYRFDASFDTGRCEPENLGEDEHGQFVWVTDVVMRASTPGEQPYFGMRDFAVDLAYVVDPSIGEDTDVDPAKVDMVAVVEIDHVDDEEDQQSAGPAETYLPPDQLSGEPEPTFDTPAGDPSGPASAPPFVVPQQPSPFPSRHRSKALLFGAAAVAALVIGGATVLLLRSSSDDQASSADPTATPSTTATHDEALRDQLRRLLPPGYPAGACEPMTSPEGAVAAMSCDKNADPAGPLSATYVLARDKAALDTAFGTFVGDSTVLVCPGNFQSPGPWRRNATPQVVAGTLFCGTHENQPAVAWTDDAKLMLSVVQSGPGGPTLDQLYGWWSSHS